LQQLQANSLVAVVGVVVAMILLNYKNKNESPTSEKRQALATFFASQR